MKVVSLLSGGLDSSVTMSRLAIEGHEIFPLFIDYGQTSREREFEGAQSYLRKLSHERINPLRRISADLSFLNTSLLGTKSVTRESDENFHTLSSKKIDWVPARNIIFLSLAASYAESVDSRAVSIGAYKEDEMPPYPDSSPEFLESMQVSLSRGLYDSDNFQILAPFIDLFKWDTVAYANEHGLPIENTWSCYQNGTFHCGTCRNCTDRKKAFEKAEITDPTLYS